MTSYLHIKNWRKFQHYKGRCPPWVKLHFEILASTDWVTLADDSKLVMVACMVIGSRHDGKVPNDPAYIRRVAYLSKPVNLKPLIECGFLSETLADDSAVQAHASESKQMLAPTPPELDTEKKDSRPKTDECAIDFDAWYKTYPRHEARGKALKAYRAARKKIAADELLAAAECARKKYSATEHQFIPMPATWLNGECWADEAPRASNGNGRQLFPEGII